jgi:[glutamine synthetase] adenylyltransferase / [glutamine synthetase]-adenylyl-L-tyrosine phosphorylase
MAGAVRDAITRGSPDPADALRLAEQVGAAGVPLGDLSADALAILVLACQRGPYLARLLGRDPARLSRVAADPYLRREKPRAILAADLAGRIPAGDDEVALQAALRRFRADEMVRLGAREFGLGDPREVGRELAGLAEVCLDSALAFHDRRLRARYGPPRWRDDAGRERDCALSVIGMGKLGGHELNFASDIDLIFVYSSDAGAAGPLSLNEYYARLCERITAALSDVTDEDLVFRVDLRLRPEGSRGTIANSLPSAERYYETWGRPWERQAWLKARPCAGDPALGAEVMATMAPFIHPRSTSPRVIAEVAELNRRIKAELDSAGVESGFDLKNGIGGIREVEFFVQALQLIHAGHRQSLRARSTLVALDQLLFAGLITETEHRALAAAYVWLRGAEHLLQLESGLQTQRLPTDP